MPNDEAPDFMRKTIAFLILIIVLTGFTGLLFKWSSTIDKLPLVYNIFPELYSGLVSMSFFGLIGAWFIVILFIALISDIFSTKTKEELKYEKKIQEIKKKYTNKEVRELKRKEARAEWKLAEVHNALKELK